MRSLSQFSANKVKLLVALAMFAACTPDRVQYTDPPVAPPLLTLSARDADASGRYIVGLTLVDERATTVVGSFRVSVVYDSTLVRFVGARGADSTNTVVFDAGGRVNIAGAAAAGFKTGEWLHLIFESASENAVSRALTFEVAELGDLRGQPLRPGVLTRSTLQPRQ